MPQTVNQNSCFISLLSASRLTLSIAPTPDLRRAPVERLLTKISQSFFHHLRGNNAVWEYGTAPRRWGGSGGLVRVKKKSSVPSPYAFYFKCSQTLWKHHHWHALSSPKHIYRPAQTLAPVRVPLQLKSPWALHARKAEKQQQQQQQSNVPVPKNICFNLDKDEQQHHQCLEIIFNYFQVKLTNPAKEFNK